MAFSMAVSGKKTIYSGGKMAWGTWTSGATTGGDLTTTLKDVYMVNLTTHGAAVSADQSAVNETLPRANGVITIVTTNGADGYWQAFGK